jgi:predicted RNase H-like HicB family nuclease
MLGKTTTPGVLKVADSTVSSGSFTGWSGFTWHNRSTVDVGHFNWPDVNVATRIVSSPGASAPMANYYKLIFKYYSKALDHPLDLIVSEPAANYGVGAVTAPEVPLSTNIFRVISGALMAYAATPEPIINFKELVWHFEPSVSKKVQIRLLRSFLLKSPIAATVEFDRDYFIAKCEELPLHAFGDSRSEAVENLKEEIEEVYMDLRNDDNLTSDWSKHKSYLISKIGK